MHNELSRRDLRVISFVAHYRVATSYHIQTVCFANLTNKNSRTRSVRRVLQRLSLAKYLLRISRNVGGPHSGSLPYVYALGPSAAHLSYGASVRITKHATSLRKLSHSLLITDVAVALLKAKERSLYTSIFIQLEPYCWRTYINKQGYSQSIRPDLFVITETDNYKDYWFIEVDRGTEHMPTIRRKCKQYQQYYLSGEEQRKNNVFPKVLWLVSTQNRRLHLQHALQQNPQLEANLFEIRMLKDFIARF